MSSERVSTVERMSTTSPSSFEERLAARLRRRIVERNLNALIGIFGPTGSGKTYSAVRLAELVDPAFDIHRIAFDVGPFMQLVDSNLPRGSAILFDDAGLGMNSRDWQSASNKILSKVSQAFRYKHFLAIITAPDIGMIDSQVRTLFHLILQTTRKDTAKKTVTLMPIRWQRGADGNLYTKFEREDTDLFGTVRVKRIRFHLPSFATGPQDTWPEYEAMKRARLDPMFRTWKNQVGVPPDWVLEAKRLIDQGKSKVQTAEILGKDRPYMIRQLRKYALG